MARGIEPVIAAVILIAIAVVVAIAVIGWIMGLWGAVTAPREQLSVTGVSLKTNGTLTLVVVNSGGATASITAVTIDGPNCSETVQQGDINPNTVESRSSMTVTVETGCENLPVGAMYTVTVYTEAGGAYPTVVKAVG